MSRGGSVIISPLGEVVAGPLWDQEGILYAEIDLAEVSQAKLDFDSVGHYARGSATSAARLTAEGSTLRVIPRKSSQETTAPRP